ncbi:hypothetical protein [Variovorax sp. PCZ-1]|uniref:hypothetical protein n=1 Tax=Variovorax sp. PCZ-1 TaxID=2835533 RepID=UPI001BCE9722|nr:hypothetical protein [Variovorax sp. PCZ-1]MBS7808493.1 hypothetical protein [Variovorax sp. PCZ-1]
MLKSSALIAFLCCTTTIHAAQPVFVANCPGDINIDAGRTGVVYINGIKAKVQKINDKAYDFMASGITISVSSNPGQAPDVTYTGKAKAHGICNVSGFEDSKATPPAVVGSSRANASGNIACGSAQAKVLGQCPFTVARQGHGTATITITLADGRKRAIFFEKGKPTGADLSQADGDMSFKATKRSDTYKIQAGRERFEIPEAAVYGG